MANYTATSSVSVYNTVEEAVAGLETKLEAIGTGQQHLTFGVIQIEGNRYAAWVVYTAEA